MNPDEIIKPWLEVIGKADGLYEVHNYRWPDASARLTRQYATYQILSMDGMSTGTIDQSETSTYTAVRSAWQQWLTTVQIDLYNSQNGAYELASYLVALQHDPQLQQLLGDHIALYESDPVQNITTFDDERIDYHFRVVVRFIENVEYTLTETNAIVETVNVSYDIEGADDNAFIAEEPGTFPMESTLTGTATFVEA